MAIQYYNQTDLRKMLEFNNEMIEFQGIKENPYTNDAAIPRVYGYQRVVGPRIFFSTGKTSDILVMAIALGQGEITGVTQLLIDDQPVTMGQGLEAGDSVTISSGIFSNVLEVEFRTPGSGSSNLIRQQTGIVFSPSDVSYIVIKAIYRDPSPYRSVPKITCDVLGQKIYDGVADDVIYSNNPAWVMYNLMAQFTTNIDVASLTTVANYFDETVGYAGGVTGPRYTCNLTVDTSRPLLQTVRELQDAYGIYMTWTNGEFVFYSEEDEQASPPTITEENIIGGINIVAPDFATAYTNVEYDYRIPDSGFATFSETLNINECVEYPTANGGTSSTINTARMSFPMITNPEMASRIARTKLIKQSYQASYAFTSDYNFWDYDVGQQIILDIAQPNITRTVTITSLKYNLDHTVDVTAVDWDDSYTVPGLNPNGEVKGVFYYNYYNSSGEKVVAKSSGKLNPQLAFAYNEPTTVDEYQTIVYEAEVDVPVYTPPDQIENPGKSYVYTFATANTMSDNADFYIANIKGGAHDYYTAINTTSQYSADGTITRFTALQPYNKSVNWYYNEPMLYKTWAVTDRQARTNLKLFFVYELDDGDFGLSLFKNNFIVKFDPERGDNAMTIINKTGYDMYSWYGFYVFNFLDSANTQCFPTFEYLPNRLHPVTSEPGLYTFQNLVSQPAQFQGIRYINFDWGKTGWSEGHAVGTNESRVVKMYRVLEFGGSGYEYIGKFNLDIDYDQIITPNLTEAISNWSTSYFNKVSPPITRPF